jgi:hypothetical protein
VSERCEVRLVQNINVSSGLVNSSTGYVVKVIYDNADAKLLQEGRNPPPYCIIVDFTEFHGFIDIKDTSKPRNFPFPLHPTWVPIYRKKFQLLPKCLPTWIRKKQLPKHCYRQQFPLDLSSNITAHRAQGQTMKDCLVSVDLNLDNPDTKLPTDIASILYVAITRVVNLKNLFVSPVFPDIWQKIGKSAADVERRAVEEQLRRAALEFASKHGQYELAEAEFAAASKDVDNSHEWLHLQQQQVTPVRSKTVTPSLYSGLFLSSNIFKSYPFMIYVFIKTSYNN